MDRRIDPPSATLHDKPRYSPAGGAAARIIASSWSPESACVFCDFPAGACAGAATGGGGGQVRERGQNRENDFRRSKYLPIISVSQKTLVSG